MTKVSTCLNNATKIRKLGMSETSQKQWIIVREGFYSFSSNTDVPLKQALIKTSKVRPDFGLMILAKSVLLFAHLLRDE